MLSFFSSEIVDRELNDEELDKVSSKDDIRRELSSLLALEAAITQEEDMKRTSLTAASAKEAKRNKVGYNQIYTKKDIPVWYSTVE
jgi:hypothetical protein